MSIKPKFLLYNIPIIICLQYYARKIIIKNLILILEIVIVIVYI